MKPLDSKKLYSILQDVQKPGRYIGGEFGSISKDINQPLKIALCFPDLYEIAMSNQAIKLLYQYFNSIEGVLCERVFIPYMDFEKTLREEHLPLFSLESYLPIKDFDILAISIGYELSLTNIFTLLELSGIPIYNKDRGVNDPIIIAGGPAVTNPYPFSSFIDFIYMGEFEAQSQFWIPEMVNLKKNHSEKQDLIKCFKKVPGFWYSGKKEITQTQRWQDFGGDDDFSSGMPVPSINIVQDQGVVEIMRGCPNKCRFCHAGVFYRPKREKSWSQIFKETDFLVKNCGYRTITLSSLSTGDFRNIDTLVKALNERYASHGVSFNLPSLRVNSISLELLSLVSVVRKSGLTFAVEAPTEESQKSLNKDVSTDRIIQILSEAKANGWKKAKFYFMLGLPSSPEQEELKIIEYINHIQHNTGIQLHVNIGTFIPKSFTPYSRSEQKTEDKSLETIQFIKRNINNKRIRISYHSPFASFLEAIISRGAEWAGELFLEGYRRGARFDAWEEYLDRRLWQDCIKEQERDIVDEICLNNKIQDRLDKDIDMGVSLKHLEKEFKKSSENKLTIPCESSCSDHCGVCDKDIRVKDQEIDIASIDKEIETDELNYYILDFNKSGRSIFWGHLDIMHTMERAFVRAGLIVEKTKGFNPKPKLEFASPLSLGISSDNEFLSVQFKGDIQRIENKIKSMDDFLPNGLSILSFKRLNHQGKVSMMKYYYGSKWEISGISEEQIEVLKKHVNEKELDQKIVISKFQDQSCYVETIAEGNALQNPVKLFKSAFEQNMLALGVEIKRIKTLANKGDGPCSFFNIYP